MLWLGFDPLYSMKKEIGSRREFSSLKRPKDKFNNDLMKIFESSNKILKNKGKIVVIIGDGKIDGEIYKADENLKKIGKSLGWKLIDSSFTLLDETSKSFQKSYRTLGKKEHILVFEKLKL
jgi:site-specific DNA-methyltransferase (cytosine-N4-specific)